VCPYRRLRDVRAEEGAAAPVLLFARPPVDPAEERTIRKLAGARHAPGDWIQRARMIAHSWDGLRTTQIATGWAATRRRCGRGCTAATPRASTGSATGQDPADRGASPRPTVAGSSPWPARRRPAGCSRVARGCCHRASRRQRRSGPWTPWPRPPTPRASGWAAARSAASCWPSGALAADPLVDDQHPTWTSPQKGAGHRLLHHPAAGGDRVCADQLGPVVPRSFPPAPGWTADGHRVKPRWTLAAGRSRTWAYGALRVADGQQVTMTAPWRNSVGYQRLLAAVETANPAGTIMVITDNLSSHHSVSTREWLVGHPRIQHAFIPTVATCQLNARARPWLWGRPPPSPRHQRRVFAHRLEDAALCWPTHSRITVWVCSRRVDASGDHGLQAGLHPGVPEVRVHGPLEARPGISRPLASLGPELRARSVPSPW
jgi:DDE superfamily endonuclease